MNLDEIQKATVRDWIETGLGLSEIQSKLNAEFGASMTYMEVRFLVDDLGILPKDPETEAVLEAADPKPASREDVSSSMTGESGGDEAAPGDFGDPMGPGGNVSVTVDQITRAGAQASGRVTFSDGKGAGWTLDQFGRLGLSADEPGYKPPQEDVMAFQVKLQKELWGPRF
ncbi:MAG: hypothetical protein M2R45_02682 [Verrucomicrobia subdivision 3 bacterium]|nr:hypothetical protein [Limisphaerales bacterium]MCS1414058.1 hypothetical protein [Limisphaerales bacterium]